MKVNSRLDYRIILLCVLFPVAVFLLNFLFVIVFNLGEGGMLFFTIISLPVLPLFSLLQNPGIPYNVTYAIYFFSVILFYLVLGIIIAAVKVNYEKTK